MTSTAAPLSRRERTRAATIAEIKELARAQMAAEGTAALNLRALARDMGVVPSALYRYFPGRDELMTALIIDAFDGLADAMADALEGIDDPVLGWLAGARAMRRWALDHPTEWALVYGGPVPGYDAPPATVGPATRSTDLLVGLLRRAIESGRLGRAELKVLRARAPREHLRALAASPAADSGLPPELVAAGLSVWTHLLGLVSLEVFGHLEPIVGDPEPLFEAEITAALDRLALGA